MGEVCSILVPIEDWLRNRWSQAANSESKIATDSETNERGIDIDGNRRHLFLADEPVLRDLLLGIPSDHDVLDVLCTINRLVFFCVIIKWINFEVWWYIGDGAGSP